MKGQILIEVIVALGIAVVILSSITIAGITSLSNAQFTKNQTLAAQYAQQGMELVRGNRATVLSYLPTFPIQGYCILDNSVSNQPNKLLSAGDSRCQTAKLGNIFQSNVYIDTTNCDANTKLGIGTVTVTISWKDSKCLSGDYCHKSQLISCMQFK